MTVISQALLEVKNYLAYITRDNKNVYKFGTDDFLPNEIIRSVNSSGTARACITKLSQFTQANGLIDATLGSSPANPLQTFNSVVSDLSLIVAYLKCSSFRVLYNNSGEPSRIYAVPTQMLRRQGSTRFIYNELMGESGHRSDKDKHLQVFDRQEDPKSRIKRMAQQIKKYGEQFGDIVYHFKKGVGLFHDTYPIPDYYSGIEDIESDAGIQRLELRNIKKGWRAQVIVSTGPYSKEKTGELDSNGNPTGSSEYEKLQETLKKFTGEDAATIMHLEGATPETKPVVTVLPVEQLLDQTNGATDRLGRKVCRHMGVPPILVGFATAGQLGNAQELENTMELFKMTVIESQDLIKESLKIVWPEKNWDLTTLEIWKSQTATPNEAAKV